MSISAVYAWPLPEATSTTVVIEDYHNKHNALMRLTRLSQQAWTLYEANKAIRSTMDTVRLTRLQSSTMDT